MHNLQLYKSLISNTRDCLQDVDELTTIHFDKLPTEKVAEMIDEMTTINRQLSNTAADIVTTSKSNTTSTQQLIELIIACYQYQSAFYESLDQCTVIETIPLSQLLEDVSQGMKQAHIDRANIYRSVVGTINSEIVNCCDQMSLRQLSCCKSFRNINIQYPQIVTTQTQLDRDSLVISFKDDNLDRYECGLHVYRPRTQNQDSKFTLDTKLSTFLTISWN